MFVYSSFSNAFLQVIKGGTIAWAQMGDPNASIPTPQPVYMRPMFGARPRVAGDGGGTCIACKLISSYKCSNHVFFSSLLTSRFALAVVSNLAVANGIDERLSLGKEVAAVVGTRHVSKADMVRNNSTPDVSINPETFEVIADGKRLWCDPLDKVPLAQRYFFF